MVGRMAALGPFASVRSCPLSAALRTWTL